jgi:hypothetical protein
MTMRHFVGVYFVFCLTFATIGCGSANYSDGGVLTDNCVSANSTATVPLLQIANCSGTPATSLPNFDRLSAQYLDDATRQPTDNLWGAVVWGTRYYLESLLTAYEATGNRKYIQAFLDSGQSVMSLVQTMTIVDAPDPGQPVLPGKGTLQLAVTGWPTSLNSFSNPITVPTQSGAVALYAQSINGATTFEVIQQNDGSLLLEWTADSQLLQSNLVKTLSDLNSLAVAPLVWGQSVGRIKPTGAGLPAPGIYPVNGYETTIWNSEQAGGILLPFAHLLLLAKQTPGLVDEATQKTWTSEVLTIASGYETAIIPDGQGGLRLQNPQWLSNETADLDAAMDYIAVEATLRLFLYRLTEDQHQLDLAKGLLQRSQNFNWKPNPQGWLLLEFWPSLTPWGGQSQKPPGNIWDSFQYPLNVPAPATDGGTAVDLMHYLKLLTPDLCLNDSIYASNQATFQQYLLYNSPPSGDPSAPLLRFAYPTFDSTTSDTIIPSIDPFSGAGYLTPEIATQSSVDANWSWMKRFAENPNGQSIGYFLRAWARSEAAELNRCLYPTK